MSKSETMPTALSVEERLDELRAKECQIIAYESDLQIIAEALWRSDGPVRAPALFGVQEGEEPSAIHMVLAIDSLHEHVEVLTEELMRTKQKLSALGGGR